MTEPSATDLSAIHLQILDAVATGSGQTRTELVRILNVAPSTVSARVQELIDWGKLEEVGYASSKGGRRATLLNTTGEKDRFLVISLGSEHARVGIVDSTGKIDDVEEYPLSLQSGPEESLQPLLELIRPILEGDQGKRIKAACIAVPGPVDAVTRSVTHPARLPGWNSFALADWFENRLGIPVTIENDANLTALGEHFCHPELTSTITIKVGTAIGAGMVIDGKCYRGATGMGGDLTHARLPGAPDVPCACGNTGCLEAVASGRALVGQLQSEGIDVSNVGDVVDLVLDANPSATLAVREAGRTLGLMLCPIVEFLNPQAVFLGGQLSQLEVFVASVRSQLYDGCHPLVTRDLIIGPTVAGANAPLLGAVRLLKPPQPTLRD